MNGLFGEYGAFLVELIAGSAVLATAVAMWPYIRGFMDTIVFMLI